MYMWSFTFLCEKWVWRCTWIIGDVVSPVLDLDISQSSMIWGGVFAVDWGEREPES